MARSRSAAGTFPPIVLSSVSAIRPAACTAGVAPPPGRALGRHLEEIGQPVEIIVGERVRHDRSPVGPQQIKQPRRVTGERRPDGAAVVVLPSAAQISVALTQRLA